MVTLSHRLLFRIAEQAHLEMGPGPLTCMLSAAAVAYDRKDCAHLIVNMARTKQTHRRLLFRRTAATFEASVQGAVIHSQSSSTMERSVNEAAGNFGAGTTAAPKSCAASKVTVAKKRGRPATRSLTCDICGRMFAHRASIIRHRKTAHLINAADEPIDIQERFEIRHELSRSSPSDTAIPERTSPRRADENRFYGGKRPPGTAPGWTPNDDNFGAVIFGADINQPKCRRLQVETVAAPSRRVPVKDLIRQLNQHPTESVVHMARRLQGIHRWSEEDTDIIQERLTDLRSQQLEIVGQIQSILPVEQSAENMQRFLRSLQQLVDRINSAPEASD